MSESETSEVLVTGATGFIGSALVEALARLDDYEPVLALRRVPVSAPAYRYAAIIAIIGVRPLSSLRPTDT